MSETKQAPSVWAQDWEGLGSIFYVEAEGLTLEEAQAALADLLDPEYLKAEKLAVVPHRDSAFLMRGLVDCDPDDYQDEDASLPPCPDPDCRHKHDAMVYAFVCEEVEDPE